MKSSSTDGAHIPNAKGGQHRSEPTAPVLQSCVVNMGIPSTLYDVLIDSIRHQTICDTYAWARTVKLRLCAERQMSQASATLASLVARPERGPRPGFAQTATC